MPPTTTTTRAILLPSPTLLAAAVAAVAFAAVGFAEAFATCGGPSSSLCFARSPTTTGVVGGRWRIRSAASAGGEEGSDKGDEPTIVAASFDRNADTTTGSDEEGTDGGGGAAKTGSVNERLLAELSAAADREKYGKSSSSKKKKWGLESFRTRKTDEEIQRSIEEARNLNGVNPVVAITGSIFALGAAATLWTFTETLGEWFLEHPIESDVYAIERASYVVRNVAMGFVSLAAGFFGVTGIGILLLGVRVAYGVATGELDPAPLKKQSQKDEAESGEGEGLELPNVWDLMTGKKPGRRRR